MCSVATLKLTNEHFVIWRPCMYKSTGWSWQQRNQRRTRKVRKEGEIFIWSHSASSSVWSAFIFWTHLWRPWKLRLLRLLAPAGDSRHRWPRGTSRKRWPEGNWIGFVSIHLQMRTNERVCWLKRHALCHGVFGSHKGKERQGGSTRKTRQPCEWLMQHTLIVTWWSNTLTMKLHTRVVKVNQSFVVFQGEMGMTGPQGYKGPPVRWL